MLAALVLLVGLNGCVKEAAPPNVLDYPGRLSDWALFAGDGSSQVPASGVIPYDLNTPLFSDYAEKYRFVRLPKFASAKYAAEGVWSFPVGTVIAKTFAYPADLRDPDHSVRLLETRLLIHEPDGWVGIPYVWNDAQTEATLHIAGARLSVSWIQTDGTEVVDHDYRVPNVNQCKGCHRTNARIMSPIGPQTGQLNRDHIYADGVENQIDHWSRIGALLGAPPSSEAPTLAVWDDEGTGTLDERARVWLDINCAHCHNPRGPARTSALDLSYSQRNPTQLGVYKFPVAAGRGSGDRQYGIVPGHPEASILMYRLTSLDPGVMMPELGRAMVHAESVELIRQWIREMEDPRRGRS